MEMRGTLKKKPYNLETTAKLFTKQATNLSNAIICILAAKGATKLLVFKVGGPKHF